MHTGSPPRFREAVFSAIASGANSPELYNDEVIVPTMVANGYALEDARNYTGIGCVEPSSQAKSFASTDAAIFNATNRKGTLFCLPFPSGISCPVRIPTSHQVMPCPGTIRYLGASNEQQGYRTAGLVG